MSVKFSILNGGGRRKKRTRTKNLLHTRESIVKGAERDETSRKRK